MHEIVIKSGEIFLHEWDSDKNTYKLARRDDQRLLPILQCRLIRIEDTTFEQFMNLIRPDAEIFEKVFQTSMGSFPIEPYFTEMDLEGEKCEGIDFVELYWGLDYDDCTSDGESQFYAYPGFHGWGDWDPSHFGETKGGIAIEYTPINTYKHLELRVNTDFAPRFNFQDPVMETRKPFTVYDLVNGILFELTWAGDPNDRNIPEYMEEEDDKGKSDA